MVNVSGLQRRSTYEEVAKAAELDEFRDLIKTPDRLPKTIIDAPSLTALEGGEEHEEALARYEKQKRTEEARRSEVEEVAQRRGGFKGPARKCYQTCEAPAGRTHL